MKNEKEEDTTENNTEEELKEALLIDYYFRLILLKYSMPILSIIFIIIFVIGIVLHKLEIYLGLILISIITVCILAWIISIKKLNQIKRRG